MIGSKLQQMGSELRDIGVYVPAAGAQSKSTPRTEDDESVNWESQGSVTFDKFVVEKRDGYTPPGGW